MSKLFSASTQAAKSLLLNSALKQTSSLKMPTAASPVAAAAAGAATSQHRSYSPRKIRRDPYNSGNSEEPSTSPQQEYYDAQNVSYSYPQFSSQTPLAGNVLQHSHGVAEILSQPCLVMERQMELMNVFLGFEQANRYAIMDIAGNHIGYMEEEDFGFTKALLRQVYRLHRPFSVRVLNRQGEHVLTIRRSFSLINSRIKTLLPGPPGYEPIVIGESKQQWHMWRRKYNLFLYTGNDTYDQFGAVDAPFLAFTFNVNDEQGALIGSVERNWVGLGRELFTDTGVYILKMDPQTIDPDIYTENPGLVSPVPMTLDQRAVLLATAVSIDFDYFSRHSRSGGLFAFNSYE